jgi:mono/diheme cytochrome c family protein
MDSNGRGVKFSRNQVSAVVVLGCICAGGLAFGLISRPAIKAIARPDPQSFSASLIERGATLAAIGDCDACHTANGKSPYAGGMPIATPFGTLYVTNITPDEATGIGNWSREAFRRAMREGVSRDGRHLYPAFPYDHFTKVDDADLDALYAFLMTRRPISATAPTNNMIFPFGFRPLLVGWKLLFLREGPFVRIAGQSDEWNRGAYLVEGLGHCGDCHTPRDLAGGEKAGHAYAGGVAENWNAPPLDGSNPAPRGWTISSLENYLRTSIDADHSAAAGPMQPVAEHLSTAPDTDVRAIAVYVSSLMHGGTQTPHEVPPIDKESDAKREHPVGATLFAGACGGCHEVGAPMMVVGRPALSLVSVIQEDDPRNTVQIVLEGLQPPMGGRGPYMPSFAENLANQEIVELAAYLRSRFSARAAWPELAETVARLRKEGAQP